MYRNDAIETLQEQATNRKLSSRRLTASDTAYLLAAIAMTLTVLDYSICAPF